MKEYLVFPYQVFWLVLFTESSLDKHKQGFSCWAGNAIYSFVTDTTFIKWNVSEGFGNYQEEEVTAFTIAACRLWHPDAVSRLMFPFKSSVGFYGSRTRGKEPYLKPGMMAVPAVWYLQGTISCLRYWVFRDSISAVPVVRDLWQFLVLMMQWVLSHAETSIMNYSERIRLTLFITSVALKNPIRGRGKRWRKTTAWKTAW